MKFLYLLSRTGGNLLRNKKKYLLFFIEIAIAGALSIVCVSFVISGDQGYRALERDPTAHSIEFTITSNLDANGNGPRSPQLQLSDYQYIQQKYGDRLTPAFFRNGILGAGNPEQDQIKSYRVFAVTDGFFDDVFRAKLPGFEAGRTVYAPADFIEGLPDFDLNPKTDLTQKDFSGYELRDIQTIANGSSSFCYGATGLYQNRYLSDLDRTILVPLSFLDGNTTFQTSASLWVLFPGQPDTAVINDILQYLQTKYGSQYEYKISSVLQSYETSRQSDLDLMNVLEAFSIICFTITAIGLFGLILLTVNRRRHDIATSMLLGAKRRQICLEFLLEIEAVVALGCLAGLLIGLLIGGVLAPQITIFEFRIDAAFTGFLVLFNMLGGALLSFAAINRILRIQPADAVRKDA